MFGLGKRNKYNGIIDVKLNNEYQITTRDNSKFPGALAYLELIDNAWNAKMSEDDGALYIATLYYCGILKKGHYSDAAALLQRIHSIAAFGLSKRLISQSRWEKFSAAIDKANAEMGLVRSSS